MMPIMHVIMIRSWAVARAILAGAVCPIKKQIAAAAAFSQRLKAQGVEDNADALDSRGVCRKRYMEKYRVWQSREKSTIPPPTPHRGSS